MQKATVAKLATALVALALMFQLQLRPAVAVEGSSYVVEAETSYCGGGGSSCSSLLNGSGGSGSGDYYFAVAEAEGPTNDATVARPIDVVLECAHEYGPPGARVLDDVLLGGANGELNPANVNGIAGFTGSSYEDFNHPDLLSTGFMAVSGSQTDGAQTTQGTAIGVGVIKNALDMLVTGSFFVTITGTITTTHEGGSTTTHQGTMSCVARTNGPRVIGSNPGDRDYNAGFG